MGARPLARAGESMAADQKAGFSGAAVGWLTLLFVVGNAILTYLLRPSLGFAAIPLGVGVSGALTLATLLIWQGRRRTS